MSIWRDRAGEWKMFYDCSGQKRRSNFVAADKTVDDQEQL